MSRDPWASYWSGGGDSGESACLPGGGQGAGSVLDGLWREFARLLPRRARVLDLATGSGIVLRKLLSARSDLKLTGVDTSPVLPPAPSGIRLLTATGMEKLPFPDRGIDAVTSQFGVEYGDTARIAAEVMRVVTPGASLRFVIHHDRSLIVFHNLARREALAWAARESGLLDKARRLTEARRRAAIPTPRSFHAAVEEGRRRYPGQTVAAEFATAVVRTLDAGFGRPSAEAIATLEALAAQSDDEIGRIDALRKAACGRGEIERIVSEFGGAGLSMMDPRPLAEQPADRPFAWLLDSVPK